MTNMRQAKGTLARRWLVFASEDARVLPALINEGAFGLACFHAQQAAEKGLKAIIAYYRGRVPKSHSLVDLWILAVRHIPKLNAYEDTIRSLDRYYTPTRYPDALPGMLPEGLPNDPDAKKAQREATELLVFIEQALEE